MIFVSQVKCHIVTNHECLVGNSESALSMAQVCVNGNHSVIAALLLQAVIHLQKGNQQQCGQLLETALSTNFEVRNMCFRKRSA